MWSVHIGTASDIRSYLLRTCKDSTSANLCTCTSHAQGIVSMKLRTTISSRPPTCTECQNITCQFVYYTCITPWATQVCPVVGCEINDVGKKDIIRSKKCPRNSVLTVPTTENLPTTVPGWTEHLTNKNLKYSHELHDYIWYNNGGPKMFTSNIPYFYNNLWK